MSHSIIGLYSIVLIVLIILSAFFSCAETGLMAVNRYRLRHKARSKKRAALLVLTLLQRPDRLLGMLLIGNNFANIFASAIATLLAIHFFGEKGVIISTGLLTFLILIFAEVAPKTLASLYPERIATIIAWPVFILLKLFYPIVWLINVVANGLLLLFRIRVTGLVPEPISREELRSIVHETTGKMSSRYRNMLLGILDLNKVIVDDVMIPRHEITGIDLEQNWSFIQQQIAISQHDWMPVYRENINQIVGILHARELINIALTGAFNRNKLQQILHEPYFVPVGTPLNVQLLQFQQKRKHIAFVVDEYGGIQGLLTLKDILEEIVGEFTSSVSGANKLIQAQADGSYLVEGAVTIRELNRTTHWQFPTRGPRTLSGLIIEYLEAIPRAGTSVRIANYPIEIVQVEENRVKTARVFPPLEAL